MSNNNLQIAIANVLRSIGSSPCLEKAQILEAEVGPMRSLHFRSLDLSAYTVAAIASVLQQEKETGRPSITSISFSYNPLGDSGAIALAGSLPHSISEIGLVGCDIGDAGGRAILDWVKGAPPLKMICIEQNNFSAELKNAFRQLSEHRLGLLVVI